MKLTVVALVLPLIVLAGCGGSDEAKAPKTFAAQGTITISKADKLADDSCVGSGGYDDIRTGTQVLIRNSSGKQIALGSLRTGVVGLEAYDAVIRCSFAFTVEDVPEDGDIYSVEVSHRGQIAFKRDAAGAIALTLG